MKTDKILILSDFSNVSVPLLRYGLALADHLQAAVWIQYVYYIPANMTGEIYLSSESLKSYERSIRAHYKHLIKDLPELDRDDVNFVLSHGDLVEEMQKLVTQERIGLIVMGNRSGGFMTNILGSNANKVIQHAPCPVLSIPQEVDFQPFHKIALAIDLQKTSEEVVAFVTDFARSFNAQVDIVHISQAPVPVDVNQLAHTLDKKLEGLKHQFFHIHAAEVEEAIERHIEGNNTDLLVLLPRKHAFFDRLFQKSISRQAAYQKKTPLLTVHA